MFLSVYYELLFPILSGSCSFGKILAMKRITLSCILFSLPFFATAQNFAGESIEYDPAQNRFFSSENGGSIVQRSEDETISFFGSGLQASYGMEVMNNTLFAIDGSNVYGYDLDTETQVMQINISGAAFLNGMASDGISRLWVTDFSAKRIHEIDVSDYNNPVSTQVVSNTITTPNGIVYDDSENRLVFVNWGSNAPVKQVDLTNYEVTTVANTGLGNIDGIDNDGYGNFYLSSWSPNRITRYDAGFNVSEIISAPGITSPADICYAQAIDTLAIPNGNGTVTFVGFSTSTNVENIEIEPDFKVFPNPLHSNSEVIFQLSEAQNVRIALHGVDGKLVYEVLNTRLPAGSQRVLLTGFNMVAGQYLLTLETDGGLAYRKLVVLEGR